MYFMYISPLIGDINVKRQKLAEYTSILEKTKELKTERDTAMDAYNNISQDDVNKLNKIIPDKFDEVLFLNDMSNLASQNGITVRQFKVDTGSTDSQNGGGSDTANHLYRTITIDVRLTGQYGQFMKFLKDIENSLQLVDVMNLSINGSTGGVILQKPSDNNLQYTLVINTYSLK